MPPPEIDPNVLLQDISAATRNMQTSIGSIMATAENFKDTMGQIKDDYKQLHDTIKGNGGGIESGLEYKVLELKRLESECEGRHIGRFRDEIEKKLDEVVVKVEGYLETMSRLALANKSEKTGAQREREKIKQEKEAAGQKRTLRDILIDILAQPRVMGAITTLLTGAIISLSVMLGTQPRDRRHVLPDRARVAAEAPATVEADGNTICPNNNAGRK